MTGRLLVCWHHCMPIDVVAVDFAPSPVLMMDQY